MLVLSFPLLLLTGFLIAALLLPGKKTGESLALAFPFGMGATTLAIWAALALKLPVSKTYLIAFQILLASALFYAARGKWLSSAANTAPAPIEEKFHPALWTALTLIALGLTFNLAFPITVSDGVGYKTHGELAVKGQTLMVYRDIYGIFSDQNRTLAFHLISGYSALFDFEYPKLVQSLYYASLLALFFLGIKPYVESRTAIGFVLLLASSPMVWWHSFLYLTNLSVGVYFFCGYLYWFHFIHHKDPRYLPAAGFGFMLSAWTRYETIIFFLVILAHTYYFSIKLRLGEAPFKLLPFPLAFSGAWAAYSFAYYPPAALAGASSTTMKYLAIFVFLLLSGLAVKTLIAMNLPEKTIFRGLALVVLAAIVIVPFTHLGQERIIRLFPFIMEKLFDNVLNKFVWGWGMLLVLLVPFTYASLQPSQKHLLFNLVSVFVFSIAILAAFLFEDPEVKSRSISELWTLFFQNLSAKVNRPLNREFFAIFPALLFFFASALPWGNTSAKGGRFFSAFFSNDGFVNGLNLLICGNLLILATVFLPPRLVFLKDHWGEPFSQIQQTFGPGDNPNIFYRTYIVAHAISRLTPENAVIVLPRPNTPESSLGEFPLNNFNVFQVFDVLYPRKILWGDPVQATLPIPPGMKTYLATNDHWMNNQCKSHPESQSLGLDSWTLCPFHNEVKIPGANPSGTD